MSEAGNLADSAYEIINGIDSESQDGRMSESTGSICASRPDDVQSLDGSENHYDTDTDDESNHSSHASSIRYADQVLQSPSTHLSAHTLRYSSSSSTEGSGVVVGAIEFQEQAEGEPTNLDKISVKHTIRELTESETAFVTRDLSTPPRRVAVTVCQTMTQAYLSTKEPLRVLYYGPEEAKRAIVLKISNAIWASPKNGPPDEDPFDRHREGVYNIVPISLFGPTPELDLMESSQYQIKVEHCTSIRNSWDLFEYSIVIGHDVSPTYSVICSYEGYSVTPQWDLPHVAVVYIPEVNDPDAEDGRDTLLDLVDKLKIPCIVITESQDFGKFAKFYKDDQMNKHAVHLCLESRDPERPLHLHRQRFPIDFASFNNIDARQMNRNLAYLTSASESARTQITSAPPVPVPARSPPSTSLKKAWDGRPSREQVLQSIEQNRWFIALLVPVLMALVAPFFSATFPGWPLGGSSSSIQPASVSDILGVSSTSCAGRLTTSPRSIPTSTTTVVVNVTSTKTVQISHALPSTSTLASALSFAGFLSDKPSDAPSEPEVKKTVCSVRVYSQNELLVSVPPGSKVSWLARGAIDIDVYRGDEPLKTKLSLVDEGILVELPQKDAYGTLNVSVITTRRPKINETFEVDFGRAAVTEAFEAGMKVLQVFANMFYSTVDEAVNAVEDARKPGMAKLRGEATSAWSHAVEAGKRRYEESRHRFEQRKKRYEERVRRFEEKVSRVKRSFSPNYDKAKEAISRRLKLVKRMREEANLSVLQAQIASKLWWLKVRGKTEELAEYQRNATLFLKARYDEMLSSLTDQEKSCAKKTRGKTGKLSCSRCKGGAKEADGKDGGWKKMIMG